MVNLALTCTFSTCNNYLSAIIGLQRFFGHSPQLRESFFIQLILKGLGRNLGKEVNQKKGLTPTQLLDIYHKLDFADVNILTKWSAIILAFRTLLRKSNIVPSTYKDLGMVLMRSDVEFTDQGLLLNVRKTKTLQSKEYVLQIPVNFCSSHGLCAARMLCTHLHRTSHITEGPLFFMVTKTGELKPLLYADLLGFLKQVVPIVGLQPSDVGLHSMRRAGAAFLHSIGISLVDVMNAGDWKSLAALSYLISPLSRKVEIEGVASKALSLLSN